MVYFGNSVQLKLQQSHMGTPDCQGETRDHKGFQGDCVHLEF